MKKAACCAREGVLSSKSIAALHTGKRVHKEMDYMARKLTEEEMEAIAAHFREPSAKVRRGAKVAGTDGQSILYFN
jgi:cytochrome c553